MRIDSMDSVGNTTTRSSITIGAEKLTIRVVDESSVYIELDLIFVSMTREFFPRAGFLVLAHKSWRSLFGLGTVLRETEEDRPCCRENELSSRNGGIFRGIVKIGSFIGSNAPR